MSEEREILQTLYEYLPNLYQGVLEASNLFVFGMSTQANQLFVQVIDGLNWIMEVITLTQDAQVEKLNMDSLAEILVEIVEGMENNDNVIISDMLQYEICPLLDVYHERLEKTLEVI